MVTSREWYSVMCQSINSCSLVHWLENCWKHGQMTMVFQLWVLIPTHSSMTLYALVLGMRSDPCGESMVWLGWLHEAGGKIFLTWIPINSELFLCSVINNPIYLIFIVFECYFLTMSFVIPVIVKFSQWIGVGGWGCLIFHKWNSWFFVLWYIQRACQFQVLLQWQRQHK